MSPFSIVFFLVIPLLGTAKLQGFDIPISRNVRRTGKTLNERGELGGSIGLGNNADLWVYSGIAMFLLSHHAAGCTRCL